MNTYTIKDTDLLLGVGVKQYSVRLKELPSNDRPREKLIKNGPQALSTSELLAIVLNTGNRKEGVLEMSGRILRDYGEKSLANQTNVEQVAKDLKIPYIKASQLVACAELGRRFFQKNEYGPKTIRTAKDVYEYLHDMQVLPKEHLRGIYLNSQHKVIHDEVLSIGTINSNLIHPREVFRPAIEYGAVAVIIAHNHPSGEVVPSKADIEVTKQIVEAGKLIGIPLLDHVIVAKGVFTSVSVDYVN